MTLKGAALLAFIGTLLATVFLTWMFILHVLTVLRGAEAFGGAPVVFHLCVWFSYADGLLFCISQGAVVNLPQAWERVAQSTPAQAEPGWGTPICVGLCRDYRVGGCDLESNPVEHKCCHECDRECRE